MRVFTLWFIGGIAKERRGLVALLVICVKGGCLSTGEMRWLGWAYYHMHSILYY